MREDLTMRDPSVVTVGTNARLSLSRCKAITGTVGCRTTNRLNIKILKTLINDPIIDVWVCRTLIDVSSDGRTGRGLSKHVTFDTFKQLLVNRKVIQFIVCFLYRVD